MSSPLAIYKLIILYLLDKADGEIAMDRLSSFLLEKGYVNFVSLMQTYAEIEKSGLVRSRNSGDRCFSPSERAVCKSGLHPGGERNVQCDLEGHGENGFCDGDQASGS